MAGDKRKRSGRRAGSFRTCIGCRKRLPRKDCLRLVLSPDGEILPDLFGKLPGRGAHTCPDVACIQKALDNNAFSRAFKTKTSGLNLQSISDSFLEAGHKQVEAILATAVRSGWLQAGRQVVKEGLQAKRTALVVLASDASPALVADFQKRSERLGVPCRSSLSQKELSRYHKGKPLAVVGVGHRGIASRLRREMDRTGLLMESTTKWRKNHQQELTGSKVRGKMPLN